MILQSQRYFGLSLTTIILIIIITIILAIVIITVLLKIALSFVESRYHNFSYIFMTALLCMLVGLLPLVGCILQCLIISYRHETGLGRAIKIWLLAVIIGIIIAILIGIILIVVIGFLVL